MNLQDPETRMSTSASAVLDEADAVLNEDPQRATDSGAEIADSPDKAGITNLIEILAVIRDVSGRVRRLRYGDFQFGGRRRRRGVPGADSRALRGAARRPGWPGGDPGRRRRGRARGDRHTSQTFAMPMGIGPPRGRLT